MTDQGSHTWRYWLGVVAASLLSSAIACYAGIVAYNAEADRIRAQTGGFVDGRVPFELPVYAALGAIIGWKGFRAVLALSGRGQRRK